MNELSQSRLLSDLKQDVDSIKKKLAQPEGKTEELILEIESLKESIHELTTIFQKTLELTKEEDLSKTINDKLETVIRQNETIAKGMLAISDKVDEFVGSKMGLSRIQPTTKHTLGPPVTNRMAPIPTAHSGMDDLQMPPPPPPLGTKKRQGIF